MCMCVQAHITAHWCVATPWAITPMIQRGSRSAQIRRGRLSPRIRRGHLSARIRRGRLSARIRRGRLSARIRRGRLSPLIRHGHLGPGMGTALEATCPASRSLEASRAPTPPPLSMLYGAGRAYWEGG